MNSDPKSDRPLLGGTVTTAEVFAELQEEEEWEEEEERSRKLLESCEARCGPAWVDSREPQAQGEPSCTRAHTRTHTGTHVLPTQPGSRTDS